MTNSAKYEKATESDIPAAARLISLAFGSPLDGAQTWLTNQGLEPLRVMRSLSGGAPACLRQIPMGQYFGGKAVPMAGIAGVAVAPEARGQGLALSMMRACLRELADAGTALSCLYASTQTLYRQCGYEQAGHRSTIRIPMAHLDVTERGRAVTTIEPSGMQPVHECYGRFASRFDGMLARGQYIWDRISAWRDKKYEGFAVMDGSRIAGYTFLRQTHKDTGRMMIELSDFAFDCPQGMRAVLGFLADFGSMVDEVSFHAGPSHPSLLVLGQQRYSLTSKEAWLLRIVRIDRAITERGYAPGIDTEVVLEIEDNDLPENAGRWLVRVKDGTATAERTTRTGGAVRCCVRGLAAMYTGYMSPRALALAGLAEGEDDALARAGTIFAASTPPWMTDFF